MLFFSPMTETSTSPALLLYSLNYHLRQILDWSNFNKLSINLKKTKWIYLTNRVTNGAEIECLRSFKCLGFHIDSELSFKTQIKYIKSRLSRFSYRSKKLLDDWICKKYVLRIGSFNCIIIWTFGLGRYLYWGRFCSSALCTAG